MNAKYFRLLVNLYPPYWGTGISVRSISPDFRELWVQMKMRLYNRNYVRTHFGGSLYAMTDPWFMVMLIHVLGTDYIVWDKSAYIEFIKPARGTVTATFSIQQEQIDTIVVNTSDGQKYFPEFTVDIEDEDGEKVAHVKKTLYIRKKVQNHSLKT